MSDATRNEVRAVGTSAEWPLWEVFVRLYRSR